MPRKLIPTRKPPAVAPSDATSTTGTISQRSQDMAAAASRSLHDQVGADAQWYDDHGGAFRSQPLPSDMETRTSAFQRLLDIATAIATMHGAQPQTLGFNDTVFGTQPGPRPYSAPPSPFQTR